MSPVQAKLVQLRQNWINHGEDPKYLADPLTAATADLWLYYQSDEGKAPSPVDPDGSLQAYIDKSMEGVDRYVVFVRREDCQGCCERYKLENMVTCANCLSTICWRCRAVKGNICSCGGEMY